MCALIAAKAYQFVYLLLISIMTFVVCNKYKLKDGNNVFRYISSEGGNIVLVVFMILFFGFRPESGIFMDMMNYIQSYNVFLDGVSFNFDWNSNNILFDNLFTLIGSLQLGYTFFFVVIAIIYFGCSYLGIKRIFPDHKLAAYLVFLAAFSTFSYGTNGIKAGAAASLFIWAISYRDNLKICIPLMLVSWGFHHSMQLPVAAFVLTLFLKNSKYYFYGWAFCVLMAALHVSFFQNLFASMSDESGANYLVNTQDVAGSDFGGKGGFRIDFLLYSAMPVLAGYYAVFKKRLQISDTYSSLLHLYLCTNGVWMLCMYANFTNRIAYLSWFLYPIVLIYPFLYENWGANKYAMFRKVMLYHLGFTVFMQMIYYGGFMELFG